MAQSNKTKKKKKNQNKKNTNNKTTPNSNKVSNNSHNKGRTSKTNIKENSNNQIKKVEEKKQANNKKTSGTSNEKELKEITSSIKKIEIIEKNNELNSQNKKDNPNKIKDKKISLLVYYSFLIIYLEMLTKVFITQSIDGALYTLLFSIPFILIVFIISNIFKEKGNKIVSIITSLIITIYYVFQCVFFRLFSVLFSFNSLGMASNVIDFKDIAMDAIIKNIPIIIVYFIPIILFVILSENLNFKRTSLKNIILNFGLILLIFGLSLFSLLLNKNEIYSAYNLYYNINNEFKTTEELGLLTSTRLDIKRVIFGFDEKITNYKEPLNPIQDEENNEESNEKEITYNQIDIDFEELINNESNSTIKNILNYFKDSKATNKNEYTGMFKDKNIIFILAEGFNMIAVDPELTPTLYKLTHEGFVFNNFYSPVFLSTTGGEFQATTGLIPTQEVLSNWKKYTPTIKYALGHSFSNIGYEIQSYHDWTYTYYNRNKTMPTLGFNNYMGCGNGLNKLMSCRWLPSDIDMINVTLPLYQDYERFATYYVSVSGHAPYNFGGGNSLALKNKDLVKDLPYSNSVKAYLASQIEFDRALEALINGLEEKGILKDTVIAFAGDHYPYTLTIDEVNELSDYKRDEIVEVNHSNFVIWNSEIKEPINVDKVGSQIDILPTLLNLFGIEYDSRLIVGKDILSNEPGLAIFSNRSWVSDYGTYKNGKFTLKEGKELEDIEEYIESMNNIVSNKFTISNGIIKYKMYDYILK